MKVTLGRQGMILAVAFSLFLPQAYGFFPFGGSPMDQLQIRFIKWRFSDFDTNRDGQVSGENDGVDITLERGVLGFTAEEALIVEESFEVWEAVESSYAAFRFGPPVFDPALFATTFELDGLNLVSMQVPADPIQEATVNTPGVLGITIILFALDDTFFTSPDGSTTVPVSGGRIVEMDIVIDAALHRPIGAGLPAPFDLKGTMVHEVGHLLGIGHSPINNLEINLVTGDIVESPVLGGRDQDGRLTRVGVTPTMFPAVFSIDEGDGVLVDGGQDLAVDDVAAVTFMYPRESRDQFFMIPGYARSLARPGFTTQPILGGLITAWIDTDGDSATPRVPLGGTLTGLYQHGFEFLERGNFELRGLPKEIETPDGLRTIEATYTLTIEPMNGLRLPFGPPAAFDSTHILDMDPGWALSGATYDTVFFSEAFNENGKLFGRDNFEVGTPLKFDQARGQVVSVNTGKTLRQMLPLNAPMFGERDEVCPVNVIQGMGGITVLPSMLRGFRDTVLLQSAVGVAMVDLYYQTGPAVVRIMREYPPVLAMAQWLAAATEWSLVHRGVTICIIAACLALTTILRGRRRALKMAMAPALVLGVLWFTQQGDAALIYMTDEQMAEAATAIVEGTVTTVESRFRGAGISIATDNVIRVGDSIKGQLNKQSEIVLTMPGGSVNGYRTFSPELARFKEGEEVILFLYFVEGHGYTVIGGFQGKLKVLTNVKTGEKYLERNTPFAAKVAKAAAEQKSGSDLKEGQVGLADYKSELRKLTREQSKSR